MEKIGQIIQTLTRVMCIGAMLLCTHLAVFAQDASLSVSSVSVGLGRDVALPIELTNEKDVCGGQFSVTIPQGVSVKNVYLNNARTNGHVLEYQSNAQGNSFLILFYAQPTAALVAESGVLCTLDLSVSPDAAVGDFPVTLGGVRMASDATNQVDVATTDGTLTILQSCQVTVSATEGGIVSGGGGFIAGETVTLTATADEGYHFECWSDGSTSNPYSFVVTTDMEMTAKFSRNNYNVTYVVDGEVYESVSVAYGGIVTPPEVPSKEGYTFEGWTDVPETMPANDIVITGTYRINKYLLTFIVDGEVVASDSVEYGAKIVVPEAPVREGQTFSGWGNVPETMPANDVAVTGTFAANAYTISYMIDGTVVRTESVAFGSEIHLPDAPEKEGHTFSGWLDAPETMPANDIVITGTYRVNKYQLTFMVDGEVVASDSVEYGSKIVAPEAPVREGHTFSGWGDVPETMPANDVTVTGTFATNAYTISYMIDGTVVRTESVAFGSEIHLPDAPEKEGHTFSGWLDAPETMPANDIVITGTYRVNKYQLTFMVDGEVVASDSVEYGSKIVAPEAPVREGHTFSGWGDVPHTMPANDVTVTGTFSVNTYKIYYYVGEDVVYIAEVKYGDVIPEYVYEPTVEGDVFDGWIGDAYDYMPAHDLTYVANIITGIHSVYSGEEPMIVYDLNGRKVSRTEKLKSGIYIVNGKKTYIK